LAQVPWEMGFLEGSYNGHVIRSRAILLLAVVLAAVAVIGAATPPPVLPSAEWILDQVKILSAPDMEGRRAGTPGGERAAAHIAQTFREVGLRPGGDAGGYLQVFAFPGGQTANVIGLLPGTDRRLKDEAIVIGAHYDHLGRGGPGKGTADRSDAIHHGADDNASGTAAMLALARAFAAAGSTPRTLVFVAFGAEELGLFGSAHYVKNPALLLEKTTLMVNLDMVGRLRNGWLYVDGVDSGKGLRDLVSDAARELPLSLQLRGDPWSASDHSNFYRAGRPVLFFFTGTHADYHRPSDTWEKINAPGLASVTALTARVVSAVAAQRAAPQYVKIEAPRPRGVLFGIVLDYEEPELPGVRVASVHPGSPAERCGVQPGDVIVTFAGVTVKTLEDLHAVLRGHRAGDRINVVLVREGQTRSVEATLVERR
jgi:Peptidase family M28/PDZ domain